ncbi:MAG TPA: PGPGW domain-containing protein [Candidatus Krumholzibacterium sp.]|nr:PGPGW domain-containing protein [Candidatus Krumholzibacterium sp.]
MPYFWLRRGLQPRRGADSGTIEPNIRKVVFRFYVSYLVSDRPLCYSPCSSRAVPYHAGGDPETMFEELKTDWHIIRENQPGERFQARYEYRRYVAPTPRGMRIFKVTLGFVLIPVGMALWVLPGPGWLTIFAGLALLAGQSRWTSRLLDKTELRIRKVVKRLRKREKSQTGD